MKRRWVLAALLAGMVAAVVIALIWPGEREPEYGGKRLSEWILQSRQTRIPETVPPVATQARDAVQHIGTNAIPFLLRWMQYEPAAWRRSIRSYRGIVGYDFVTKTLLRDTREERASRGQTGFALLGTNATTALPELVKRMADQKAPYTAWRAAQAMVYLGEDALRPLLAEATNRNNMQRATVISGLGFMKYLGTNAIAAVPVLMECLSDTNPLVSRSAARSLGQLKLEPEIVLPALAQMVSTNAGMRSTGIWAIGMFGKQPTNPALSVVIAALSDSNLQNRRAATNVLRQIAPELLPREN